MTTAASRWPRAVAAAVLAAAALTASTMTASAPAPALSATAPAPVVAPEVSRAVAAGPADVIVQAHPGAVAAARAAVVSAGGEVTLDLPIVDGFAARLDAAALARLRDAGTGSVRVVSLDGTVWLQHDAPAGTYYSDSAFVETIGADRLHAAGVDGSGVGIGIIDTGVAPVADLEGRITGGVDFTPDGDGVDRYGHGTFVAGIAAGSGVSSAGEHAGVAPGAHIVPIKIAGADGSADVSHVLAALQWAVSFKDEHDIDVLNLSFGTDSSQSYTLDPMNYAVEKAWDAGIVVVVSAANAGPDARTIMKPGDDPMVITVGATDSNGTVHRSDDIVTSFSSRGPTRTDGISKPDLVAPGAHLIGLRVPGSTIDSAHPYARVGQHHFRGSGTSFATAVTSGAVALLLDLYPDWTPDEVKGALFALAAAGPVGDPNVDGKGALDVRKAELLSRPGYSQAKVARSSGLGTMDASRGNLLIEIEKDPLLGLTVLLDGDLTAQDHLFSSLEYVTTEWTTSKWYTSKWYTSKWYTSKWYEGDWATSKWYTSKWYASEWE